MVKLVSTISLACTFSMLVLGNACLMGSFGGFSCLACRGFMRPGWCRRARLGFVRPPGARCLICFRAVIS